MSFINSLTVFWAKNLLYFLQNLNKGNADGTREYLLTNRVKMYTELPNLNLKAVLNPALPLVTTLTHEYLNGLTLSLHPTTWIYSYSNKT